MFHRTLKVDDDFFYQEDAKRERAERRRERRFRFPGKRVILTALIIRLQDGPKAAGWSDREAALVQIADDLFNNFVVSDATWQAFAPHY